MSRLKAGGLLAFMGFGALFAALPAEAAQTASAAVNCSKARLQAAIDAALPGVATTIRVTGTCSELIEVPAGKTIILQGGGKAELKPPADRRDQPVVTNKGDLQLERIKVTNTATATNVVLSANSSSLIVLGSTISGSNAEVTLEISNASSGRIFNSVVRGGAGEAIGVYNSSTLEVFGHPSMLAHFDASIGYRSMISNSAAGLSALTCGDGSNLTIKTDGTGKVKVSNTAGTGISMNFCSFRARNNSGAGGIDVSGKRNAIWSMLSDLQLIGVTLAGQDEHALSGTQARMMMTGSTFSALGAGDIALDGASNITFNGWAGPTALPGAFVDGRPSLSCSNDSKIFAGEYDLDLPSGKTLDDLKRAYPDCFLP